MNQVAVSVAIKGAYIGMNININTYLAFYNILIHFFRKPLLTEAFLCVWRVMFSFLMFCVFL